MFTQNFNKYVCAGDSIQCEKDGFTIIARVIHDEDTNATDYDQPGWCFDTKDEKRGAENQRIIDTWKNDEWHYCGIGLSISRNGVDLDDNAASLWGIEYNFPTGDNAYLREVANELLDATIEAGRNAQERIKAALT